MPNYSSSSLKNRTRSDLQRSSLVWVTRKAFSPCCTAIVNFEVHRTRIRISLTRPQPAIFKKYRSTRSHNRFEKLHRLRSIRCPGFWINRKNTSFCRYALNNIEILHSGPDNLETTKITYTVPMSPGQRHKLIKVFIYQSSNIRIPAS